MADPTDNEFFKSKVSERGLHQYVVEYDCGGPHGSSGYRQTYLFRAMNDKDAKTFAEAFAKQKAESGDPLQIQDLYELRTEWREVNVGSLETEIEKVEAISKNAISFSSISGLE